MNTITTSPSAGYIATASDLGRTPRRAAASAAAPAETTAADALLHIENANRAAAIGNIDDLAGAEAAVARMRLAFAGEPSAARAAQGTPSAENALRLLAN